MRPARVARPPQWIPPAAEWALLLGLLSSSPSRSLLNHNQPAGNCVRAVRASACRAAIWARARGTRQVARARPAARSLWQSCAAARPAGRLAAQRPFVSIGGRIAPAALLPGYGCVGDSLPAAAVDGGGGACELTSARKNDEYRLFCTCVFVCLPACLCVACVGRPSGGHL